MRFAALALVVACASPSAALAQRSSVTVETLILAEDRRASGRGDYEILVRAASHRDAAMRARAVRALGRLEQRHPQGAVPADVIERALRDRDPLVRRHAAYALAQSVIAGDPAAKARRRTALTDRLARERDDAAAGALMESAARLADGSSIGGVEPAILAQAAQPGRAAAAASALEILSRRAGKPGVVSPASLDWLRAAVFDPALAGPPQRAALQALVTARAADAALAARAFTSPDFQMRRLAVLAVAGAQTPAPFIDVALRDADAHVRYEAVRASARRGTAGCPAIVSAAKDPDALVALAAIDALANCADPAVAALLAGLAGSPGGVNWHRASRALVALAPLDAARVRVLLAAHASDAAWPVRMYAAQAAARADDDQALVALASDSHPNVREAALSGLVDRVVDPADAAARARLGAAVMSALAERRDPQLLRTAAAAVIRTGDTPAFRTALLAALDAIDADRGETTVDARTAIVKALELAAPGEAVPPAPAPHAPATPSVQELRALPTRARIELARGGIVELELLPEEAPATVARFARLARAGYYDGLTFHRVVPNFVVQGGSPWANEYAGAPRFQRDEVGFARHERGAVGISTRGRDTGDAQIFIDLVDVPRLNHDYTVFARVVSGMEAVDGILEADVIRRVTIAK